MQALKVLPDIAEEFGVWREQQRDIVGLVLLNQVVGLQALGLVSGILE
ncbi:MAG TPA: hypothetical protein VMM38_12485 [Aridibacter sp.]|nr:hypothetical protein [Aridibacter sp.]